MEEHDHYGKYIKCFQCGRMLTEAEESRLRASAAFPIPTPIPADISMEAPTRRKRGPKKRRPGAMGKEQGQRKVA
ncbi:MAG: hypothetical protein M1136_09940 [Chloroflexi bacterium]|nr:hypothetical protein [Chloroflexota bacterium]MCL5075950.1 hypothetical protein [Chloroflexota bacterium]